MRLGVVIPAYNESGSLELTVRGVVEEVDGVLPYEVLIVNDNSTDDTGDVAEELTSLGEVRVVHRENDPGFGNAIKTGFRESDGDVVVPFMADRSDDPATLHDMMAEIKSGHDVVYGSRFIEGGSVSGYPTPKIYYNRAYNNLLRYTFWMHQKDITNAFKAYRKEVIETLLDDIKAEDFDITVELPVKAHFLGFSSTEVPTDWTSRDEGVSKLRVQDKGPKYARRYLHLIKWVASKKLGRI